MSRPAHALHHPAIRNPRVAPRRALAHTRRSVAARPRDTAGQTVARDRWGLWAAYTAFAAGFGYAMPHFWWYLGLTWAYPGDFTDMENQSTGQVVGDWVIAILAVLFSLLPLALVMPWGRIVPRRMLITSIGVASVGLTIWSFSYFSMRIMLSTGRVVSAPEFADQDADPAAVWGYYWYSLFLIWGLSFGATALWSRQVRR